MLFWTAEGGQTDVVVLVRASDDGIWGIGGCINTQWLAGGKTTARQTTKGGGGATILWV